MKIIKTAEEAFVGISLLSVTIVLFINIVLRYFFNANTTWAEEFIRYAMIWITFIGAGICFRRKIHVGIDLLMDFLPGKGQNIAQFIINIIAIVFMLFLIKYGIDLVVFSISTGQISPSLQIKTYWVYLAIPLGACLSLLHLSIQTYEMVRHMKTS